MPIPMRDPGSRAVASEIANLIRARNQIGQNTVLGLATGSTPIQVYRELVRLHKEENLSFRRVVTFNLDEYYPMEPKELQSYVRFMNEYLFDHIDIKKKNIHIPDGTLTREKVYEYCREYEENIEQAGGLDVQILGIGRTGHIGFNEPGSLAKTRTRLVTLDELTRADAAPAFFGEEHVPRRAITMGVGTILKAKKIYMMAWGEAKGRDHPQRGGRECDGKNSGHIPAASRQYPCCSGPRSRIGIHPHENTLGGGAGCKWDDQKIRRAVTWLSLKTGKPILKLSDEDYNQNGMSDIVTDYGPSYNVNIRVFNQVQHTITGWPGGKPNADDSSRPERAEPFPKRVLIFSPHPDDDVISMGGTLMRLVEHGHDVHVAYQTSGNISVYDDEALRYADFVSQYSSGR
jgi:glucosamine-6-phosphate deaminase